MRKLGSSFFLASLLSGIFLLAAVASSFAFDRQSNSDYHARREALARKVGGVVVLFSATENDGPNDLYGFRQDDNFFYLSGSIEPGVALLIASAADA
ncbi:MAG: aminopeptidase P N-terminal domain-containing protein, partial [Candidatus Sulfotelmatobacter sp.]